MNLSCRGFFIFCKYYSNHDKYHILGNSHGLILLYNSKGMSVIYILISISITVAVAFLVAFFRAVKTGQFDDDYTPSVRVLFDDELKKTEIQTTKNKSKKLNQTKSN